MIVLDPTQRSESVQADRPTQGIHVHQAFLIGRSPADLYAYWRDFLRLPSFLSHIQRIEPLEGSRYRWVAKAERFGNRQGVITWQTEVTTDEPAVRIAWRSLPGGDLDASGDVRFEPALGDRGTALHVDMSYVPPSHWIEALLAAVSGTHRTRDIREDVRNFQRLMETGEIPTIDGQPRGTCTGHHSQDGTRRER